MPKIGDVIAGNGARIRRGGPAEFVAGYRLWDGTPGAPDCADCKGGGCWRADVAPGHPLFGKLLECECARPAREQRATSDLQRQAGLPDGSHELIWAGLDMNPDLAPAVQMAQGLVERGWGWGYVYGPYGPGKTMLLKTVVAESIRAGRAAVFVEWADLLKHLRQGFANEDYDQRVQAWRDVPLLVVDEMGRAKETEWVAEARTLIFSHRYESALAGKTVTLFASNLPPVEQDGWFADRLRHGRFFITPVLGDSMRPAMV